MTGVRMTLIFTLVVTGILGLACWLIYDLGLTAGRDEVRAAWEAQKAADTAANARAAQQAREVEAGLLRHIDQIRRQHDKDIMDIDQRHAAALDRVRERAHRPRNYVPAAPEVTGSVATTGCGADQLFRDDAAVAIGLATAADTVRAALTECRAAYEAAQRANEESER